jgi:pyruvate/2-oxoglutarate dehydrogenase complex dihydrolipoamide dehydrogenase (E3) component
VRADGHVYVMTDSRLRTANRRIYAAGDVTGHPAFTHVAGVAGSIAAANAVLAPIRRLDPDRLPWVTFTDPALAEWQERLDTPAARRAVGAVVRLRGGLGAQR